MQVDGLRVGLPVGLALVQIAQDLPLGTPQGEGGPKPPQGDLPVGAALLGVEAALVLLELPKEPPGREPPTA